MSPRCLSILMLAAVCALSGCSKEECTPSCEGKVCGDDGCGGSCGSCEEGQLCSPGFTCVSERCTWTPGSITVDNWCEAIEGAFGKWNLWLYRTCGADVRPEDIEHLDALAPLGVSGATIRIGAQAALMTCDRNFQQHQEALLDSVRSGRLCFDSQAADACAEQGRTLAEQGRYGAPLPEVCGQVFLANSSEGEACLYSYECQEGLYCRPAGDGVETCAGTCVRPRAAGELCGRLDVCDADSFCADDGSGVTRCVALGADGEPCVGEDLPYCITGHYCDLEAQPAPTCRRKKAQGEPCLDNSQCAEGLLCLRRDRARSCQPPPEPAQLGEPCLGDTQAECDREQCLYCDGGSAERRGKCQRYPKAGGACRVGSDGTRTCDRLGLLYCDEADNTCRPKPREGEPCVAIPPAGASAEDSLTGNCLYLDNFCLRNGPVTSGTCARVPAVGEPCQNRYDSSTRCVEGARCQGASKTTAGTCVLPAEDGATCSFDEECASGFCRRGSEGAQKGTCAQPPPAGSPCDYTVAGKPRCDADSWCEVTEASAMCRARAPAGQTCTANEQCASGRCDLTEGLCVVVCDQVQRSSCWSGLDWISNFIFASGMFGLLAARRRRREAKPDQR